MAWNECDICKTAAYTDDNPFVEYRCQRPSDKSDMCCTMAGHMKCFNVADISKLKASPEGGIATPKQWSAWIESKEAHAAGYLFLT